MVENTIRIAVPNKGRYFEPCLQLLNKSELGPLRYVDRKLIAESNIPGISVVFVRGADIPWLLYGNHVELGITGRDYVLEMGYELPELIDLHLLTVEMWLMSHQHGYVSRIHDVRPGMTLATQYTRIVQQLVAQKRLPEVTILPLRGAAEAYPNLGLAELVLDIVHTRRTSSLNSLKLVRKLFDISGRLYASPNAPNVKSGKLASAVQALSGIA